MRLNFSRRTFLKWVSAISGAVAVKLSSLVPEVRATSSSRHVLLDRPEGDTTGGNPAEHGPTVVSEGELYAGFLLLPEGAAVPPTVKQPRLGIPIVCGAGVGRGGTLPTAVTKTLNTPADLARAGRLPLYTFGKLPAGLRPAGGYVIRHHSGELFGASVNFESHNPTTDNWEGTVRLWAQPDFPQPFPLWSSDPVEPDGPATILEKVDFLPSPGIMVATQAGFVFHWIKHDVLYMLAAEHKPSREAAQELVSLMRPV